MQKTESPVRVAMLRCNGCGNALRGVSGDAVFFCWHCRQAIELAVALDVTVPLTFARAEAGQVLLPFWRFSVNVTVKEAPAEKQDDVRAWAGPRQAYVPAFRVHNLCYFGDSGVALTLAQPFIDEVPEGRVAGAARGRVEAARHLETVLLTCLDRKVDVTGVRLGVAIEESSIVAWPFQLEGRYLVGPDPKVRYPFNSIEGAADIAELCGWPI